MWPFQRKKPAPIPWRWGSDEPGEPSRVMFCRLCGSTFWREDVVEHNLMHAESAKGKGNSMKKKQRKRIEAIVGLWHTGHLNISHQVIEEKFGSLEDRANRTSEHQGGRISALRADFNAYCDEHEGDFDVLQRQALRDTARLNAYLDEHADTHHDLVTQVTALEMRVERLTRDIEAVNNELRQGYDGMPFEGDPESNAAYWRDVNATAKELFGGRQHADKGETR